MKLSYSGKFIPCRLSKALQEDLTFITRQNFKLWRSRMSCRGRSMTEGWISVRKEVRQNNIPLHFVLKTFHEWLLQAPVCSVESRIYHLQPMVSLRSNIDRKRNVVNIRLYIYLTERKKSDILNLFLSLNVRYIFSSNDQEKNKNRDV